MILIGSNEVLFFLYIDLIKCYLNILESSSKS